MALLVIAEHNNAALKPATLSTVTAALQCGNDVHVLIAGKNAGAAVQAASGIMGISKVLHAEGDQFAHGLAEHMAAQITEIARAYTHILFPATAFGKNIAPRVAALLDVAQLSEITKVLAPDTFERPMYAGNVIATVRSLDKIKVITVRTTSFDDSPTGDATVAVSTLNGVTGNGKSSYVGSDIPASTRPELTAAEIVVSGGRALASADKFEKTLAPLADRLGAALGASRAAVDAGYATNDLQIGQTGKIVAPRLYFAIGISGAIQHLAGMKDSKFIVASNKDPEAPIFGMADYCLEADLFNAVPEMVSRLHELEK